MGKRWATVQPWVSLLVRLALGAIMIWAGLAKLLEEPGAAVRAVRAYRLLPESVLPAVAFGLPAIELLLGVALIIGLFTRISAAIVGVIMVVFIAAIISAWARGLSIDCGCFGGGGDIAPEDTQYVQEIVRDTGFALMAALLVRWPFAPFGVDGWLRGDRTGTMRSAQSSTRGTSEAHP